MIAKASPTRAAQRKAQCGTAARFAPRRVLCAAAALLASLAIIGEVQAQQQQQQFGPRVNQAPRQQPQQPQAPQAEVVATHGDWSVQCQEAPSAAGADGETPTQRVCNMVQTVQSDRPGIGLTLVVLTGEQDGNEVTMMRVMVPIGVYLPTGVAVEVDGEAVGRLPFARCLPQACVAMAEASPPTLEKLKAGGVANFIIYEGPGAGMALELSLKGFTAALGELNKL